MSFTLCTSGAIVRKAGLNANSTIAASGAALAEWSDQAEATVNADTRYDWVANYSSVGANFKAALANAVSALAAMNVINYDMSGFTSRQEAGIMLDVLRDQYNQAVSILQEKQKQEKML